MEETELLGKKSTSSQLHGRYLGAPDKASYGNFKLSATDTWAQFGSLDEESLQTLMTETEAIINSRPLIVKTIKDRWSPKPISPNNIPTMKTKVLMSPLGVFQKPDLYWRRRWRRIQHLINEFSSRWRREFIQTLQECQEWVKMSRNFSICDIVLLKTDLTRRNHWSMCKVIRTNSDDKRVVRSVKLLLGNSGNKDDKRIFQQPISKIVQWALTYGQGAESLMGSQL